MDEVFASICAIGPVTVGQLRLVTGFASDKDVRNAIDGLRARGVPICHSSRGFWHNPGFVPSSTPHQRWKCEPHAMPAGFIDVESTPAIVPRRSEGSAALTHTDGMKSAALAALVAMRRDHPLAGYRTLGDIHGGFYECDFVTPWTLSARNLDARLMLIGQDWASEDYFETRGADEQLRRLGHDPTLPTNRNLVGLLADHDLPSFAQCYATNLFPFIKPKGMSSAIREADMVACARAYTVVEIETIRPVVAACLGAAAFNALRLALGLPKSASLEDAITRGAFRHDSTQICCVAHTGARGTQARNASPTVASDWQRVKAYLAAA
ncbi:uracil-DNA glycosylase family protein [Ancylobacter terrae]|uniref:hypothetical protein n=1 Tax=Ancylobacter sp. sgz301288 TaxID=3342077 RepID=UPI00385F2266